MEHASSPVLTQQWSAPALPVAPSAALGQRFKNALGATPSFVHYVGPLEWLHELALRMFTSAPERVPTQWIDLAKFVTSQENACRVCFGAQRAYMRVIGYDPAWINRVERALQSATLDPIEQAIADFCRKLARSSPRPAVRELAVLLELGVEREQAAELACTVGIMCLSNRVSTFLAIPPDLGFERLGSRWWAAPIRKLMARKLRGAVVAPAPSGGAIAGEFEGILRPYAHLQWAAVLRRCVDGALHAGSLSTPIKLLMLSVIARALGCPACAAEAQRALQQHGWSAEQTDEVVGRLGGGGLTKGEEELLAFARETVRYEPRTIQGRVRRLAESIGAEPTREAVGVAALGNMLVRIGMFAGC